MPKKPRPIGSESSEKIIRQMEAALAEFDPERIEPPCPDLYAPLTPKEFKYLLEFSELMGEYWRQRYTFYKPNRYGDPDEPAILEKLITLGFIGDLENNGNLFLSRFGMMRVNQGH